jgi:hypothetical protein
MAERLSQKTDQQTQQPDHRLAVEKRRHTTPEESVDQRVES